MKLRQSIKTVIASLVSVNGASMHHSSGKRHSVTFLDGILAGEVLHGNSVNGPNDGIFIKIRTTQ